MKFSDQIQNIKRMKERDAKGDKEDGKGDGRASMPTAGIDLGVNDDKGDPKNI